MNAQPKFKYTSQLLISALIATSFVMVNCAKGTDKRGVKGTTIAGKTGDINATTTSGENTQAPVDSVITSNDVTVNNEATSGDNTVANPAEAFKKADFTISEDMKQMLLPQNLNFKSFIVDGEISINQSLLTTSLKMHKVVCTFAENSTELAFNEKMNLKIIDYVEADKKDLPEYAKGLAMPLLVSSEKSGETGLFQTLICTNLSSKKVDIRLLKRALGKHLVPATKAIQSEKVIEAAVKEVEKEKTDEKLVLKLDKTLANSATTDEKTSVTEKTVETKEAATEETKAQPTTSSSEDTKAAALSLIPQKTFAVASEVVAEKQTVSAPVATKRTVIIIKAAAAKTATATVAAPAAVKKDFVPQSASKVPRPKHKLENNEPIVKKTLNKGLAWIADTFENTVDSVKHFFTKK